MSDEEAQILIIIREKGSISNAEYRTINRVDTLTAFALARLRDLELFRAKKKIMFPPQKPLLSVATPHIRSLSEGLTPKILQ